MNLIFTFQVITKSAILQQISELVEETGLTCIICREGYKFEPKKVRLKYDIEKE